MPEIRLLPDHLISQIAAGEVVERPASVVKELVENALDAGASRIDVELEVGGKRRVRIIDDGQGMGQDDAVLAFDRHATSKIRDFDDLQRVGTLGFRGEALAAIAAVAKVELATADGEGEGWRVRVDGGRILGVEPIGRARGTTIDVRSLFFNVPARRKFLKTTPTELRRCLEVVQGYCLASPDVGFGVRHEGRSVLEASAVTADVDGLRARIRQLFGKAVVDQLVELPARSDGDERIAGFVGTPASTRGRRTFVFVNGRLLRDRQILATFYRAVREEWKHSDFPSLFLFLGIPASALDVNVHPQKSEVRFRDGAFFGRLRWVLGAGLREARGEGEAPLVAAGGPSPELSWQGLGSAGSASSVAESGWSGTGVESGSSPSPFGPPRIAEVAFARKEPASVPLSGPGGESRTVRILGQYKGALLLLESAEGLLLMDQHAAHERVLYERLRASWAAAEVEVQRLLVPRLLSLSRVEKLQLLELSEPLRALGFEIEELSGDDLALTALPAVVDDEQAMEMLSALATGEREDVSDPEAVRHRVAEEVTANGACRSAIKIHRPLPSAEQERLVTDLFACDDPWACPHGRPTVLKMTDAELERRFGRR